MGDKEEERKLSFTHMKQVFNLIDENRSGEISVDELEYFLAKPELRKYIEALQISPDDTRMLFKLIDADGSDSVDIDEFCVGCFRLKGDAKAFDVHALIFQVRNFLRKWSDFTMYVEDAFDELKLKGTGD